MPGSPVDDQLAARVPDDPGDDPERRLGVGEHRALLDVELEKGARQRISRRDQRATPDAADLLPSEHDDGARSGTFDGIDRGDDSERPVVAATPRDAVEV